MIKRVELSTLAQSDLAALDRTVAARIIGAIGRLAATGAGNVKGLHGIHPPLRVGDWRVRFHDKGDWIEILRIRNRKNAYN